MTDTQQAFIDRIRIVESHLEFKEDWRDRDERYVKQTINEILGYPTEFMSTVKPETKEFIEATGYTEFDW